MRKRGGERVSERERVREMERERERERGGRERERERWREREALYGELGYPNLKMKLGSINNDNRKLSDCRSLAELGNLLISLMLYLIIIN